MDCRLGFDLSTRVWCYVPGLGWMRRLPRFLYLSQVRRDGGGGGQARTGVGRRVAGRNRGGEGGVGVLSQHGVNCCST